MLAQSHANAKDAIFAWPRNVVDLYVMGDEIFDEHLAPQLTSSVAKTALTFEELRTVAHYLFTITFITAWYHLEHDKPSRNKLAGTSGMIAYNVGGLHVNDIEKLLTHFEESWVLALTNAGLPAKRRFGCITVVAIFVALLSAASHLLEAI